MRLLEMPPYEALYGCRDLSPLYLDNVGALNDSSAYHRTKDECILKSAKELC
jgi:hypothetical protein